MSTVCSIGGAKTSSLAFWVFVLGIALAIGASRPAVAGLILDEPILGGSLLVANDGPVTATFLGSDAGYFNTLYLDGFDGPIFSKSSEIGDSMDFDSAFFSQGTELVFRMEVRKRATDIEPMHIFKTGPSLRNPDRLAHAVAITTFDAQMDTYFTTVGLEDWLGGGDEDFNDFVFQLSNVVDPPERVPAPPVVLLLGFGIAVIGYQRHWQSRAA